MVGPWRLWELERATWERVLSIIKTHTLCYLCVGPLWKRDAASQTAIQNEIENRLKTAIKQTQKLRIWCLLRIALQLFKIIIIILIGQLLPAATAPFISCSSDLKGENNYIILIKKIEEKLGATDRYECICTDPCHSVARRLGHQVKRLHLLNLNIKVRLLSFFFILGRNLAAFHLLERLALTAALPCLSSASCYFYFPFQNHTDFDSAVQLDEGRGHLTWCSISFYRRFLTAARPRPVSELHKRRKQGRPEWESFKTPLPGLLLPPDGRAKLTQQIQETLHTRLLGSVVFPVWQFILF